MNDFTVLNEYWLSKSKIELNHDRTGLLDDIEKLDIIEFRPGIINQIKRSKSDPANGKRDDLITYFNFVMDPQANLYTR